MISFLCKVPHSFNAPITLYKVWLCSVLIYSTVGGNISYTILEKLSKEYPQSEVQTFSYGENGLKGLITGKKVYLSVALGAVFSDGPYKSHDFAEPYLRVVLGFLGITDVTTFCVEGTSISDLAESALPNALAAVKEFAF